MGAPDSMRQIVIPRHGGPDVLRLEDAPLPQPGPGQLRIAVSAAGINFADILIRQGVYPGARPPPCVPGHEISGVVDEVGDGVDPMWKGRPVLALGDYGGYAQYHVIDADRVLPKPADLEFPAAAGLPLNYVTAWLLLIVMGSLRGDQTLLIQNAGGGVGLAALDIARHVGARTIGTASPGKHEFLLSRGLDHAVDYRQSELAQGSRHPDPEPGRGSDHRSHGTKKLEAGSEPARKWRPAGHVRHLGGGPTGIEREAASAQGHDRRAGVPPERADPRQSRRLWL